MAEHAGTAEITNVVSVSRRIPAPASTVFELLTDPVRHPEIDGSGMVRNALDAHRIRGIGDAFVMAMHNDEMGEYEMTSHVVEYEQDRRIVWEPVLSGATREDEVADIGESAHQRWGYTLAPEGAGVTLVTETFDCRESPEWLQKAVRGGERWSEAMTVTLERLELASASVQPA